jgi:hypothetical protein
MRKTTSLAITAALLISSSGCRSGNVGIETRRNYGTDNTPNQSRLVGMDERNNGVNNNTINYGRTSGIGGNNNTAGNFRDGTYTNFGNGHSNGNEKATVVIQNGKIVSIDLSSVSQQEANSYRDTGRMGLYNTPGTGTAAGMDAGTNNNLTGFGTGTNNNNGTIAGINGGPNNNTGTGTTGISTDTNNITNTGNGTGIGTNTGTATGTGSNTNYNTDNANGAAFNQAKTNLIAAMIQKQSDNVLDDNNDGTMGNTIDNWKLAVSRALYQARR